MEELDNVQEENKRPKLLNVLCILSFISIGFTFLGAISQAVKGPFNEDEMMDQKVELTKSASQLDQLGSTYFGDQIRKMIVMTENLNESFTMVNMMTFVTVVVGFFGVFKMFKGEKLGFHFYIVYSLLGAGQVYFFVSPSYVPSMVLLWNVIIAGIFVYLYSRNLKWLK